LSFYSSLFSASKLIPIYVNVFVINLSAARVIICVTASAMISITCSLAFDRIERYYIILYLTPDLLLSLRINIIIFGFRGDECNKRTVVFVFVLFKKSPDRRRLLDLTKRRFSNRKQHVPSDGRNSCRTYNNNKHTLLFIKIQAAGGPWCNFTSLRRNYTLSREHSYT